MNENMQPVQTNGEGRIVVGQGQPVYSQRTYNIRRFERHPYDKYEGAYRDGTQSSYPLNRGVSVPPAIIYEDVETGLLTTNIGKFEKWIGNE